MREHNNVNNVDNYTKVLNHLVILIKITFTVLEFVYFFVTLT